MYDTQQRRYIFRFRPKPGRPQLRFVLLLSPSERGEGWTRYRLIECEGNRSAVIFDDAKICPLAYALRSVEFVHGLMLDLTNDPYMWPEETFYGYTEEQLAFAHEYAESLRLLVCNRWEGEDGWLLKRYWDSPRLRRTA
jgi:hypothetical protein